MRDYSFSIKLPELNLPPVAPITVPEEGNPFAGMGPGAAFRAPSQERVAAQPDFPGAGAVREALQGVARGEGVKDLADALAAAAPKQADYNRAVMELEERVRNTVKTTENPAFAPGVPLAPEFASMLSAAKDTAFDGVRPYLPRGVEPELALFMLTTLPVLTVALRTADENSRRPKPDPLPPGYRPPRVVRFPNSPAKADAEAVAEARKAREAQSDLDAVQALRSELSARGLAAVPTAELAGGTSVSAAAAAVVDLEDGVAAAVAAKPETMTAELARLRGELAAAGKLAAKVEALERANARLSAEVAGLRKEPSLEEIKLRAEKEAARVEARRERDERRAAAFSDMKVKADKLSAARQAMADGFPSRETDMAAVQATEIEPVPEPEPEPTVDEGEEEEEEEQAEEEAGLQVLKPEDVDPLSAARERLADAFPGSDTAVPAAAATKKKVPAAKKAAAAKKKAAPKKKAATAVTMEKKEEPKTKAPKKPTKAATAAGKKKSAASGAAADAAPTAQNGAAPTPDDYDDLSEDLSRALRGVQGYDLDALDLEMDDLRLEDLEELRNLELEMGDLDLASLEAEFDQEDDESISQALRMAAESALAHTSGGGAGRRIRTASPVGATSSRSAGGGGGGGSRGGSAVAVAEGGDGAAAAAAMGGRGGGGGGGVSAAQTAEDELDAFRRLEAEAGVDFGAGAAAWAGGRPGGAVGGRGGGGEVDDGDWSSLSSKAIGRKKVSALKEYLDEEGVDYPGKAKKAQLVELVVGLLAEG